MKLLVRAFLCALTMGASLSSASTFGSTEPADTPPASGAAAYSSSQPVAEPTLPEAPRVAAMGASEHHGEWTSTRPFSSVGVAVKVGVAGIGFDVATPLAKHLNLRGGASFFSYSHTFIEDGLNIDANLHFRSVNASLDYYPFHGTFRLSPGVVLYNGNKVTGDINVLAGNKFTLNDQDYTSSATDPVTGSIFMGLGKKAAPSFTVGWGNMLPRHGGHFSVPFEIGFAYVQPPTVTLDLHGTACSSDGCGDLATDPESQANIRGEQNDLNNDLHALGFYPIVSIGVSYKFGR